MDATWLPSLFTARFSYSPSTSTSCRTTKRTSYYIPNLLLHCVPRLGNKYEEKKPLQDSDTPSDFYSLSRFLKNYPEQRPRKAQNSSSRAHYEQSNHGKLFSIEADDYVRYYWDGKDNTEHDRWLT